MLISSWPFSARAINVSDYIKIFNQSKTTWSKKKKKKLRQINKINYCECKLFFFFSELIIYLLFFCGGFRVSCKSCIIILMYKLTKALFGHSDVFYP